MAVVSVQKPSGGAELTRRRGEAIAIAAALFGVSVAVSVRVLTLETLILNNDESAYAADAVAVSRQHTLPLLGSCDDKPPGIFWIYQAAFAVGGPYNMLAVRTLFLGWVLTTIAVLFLAARALGGLVAGCWAVALYSIAISLDPRLIACKTEILLNLPLVTGLLLCIKGFGARRWSCFYGAGVALGVMCLFKQPAICVLAGALAGFVILAVRPVETLSRGRALSAGLWVLSGAASVGGATLLLYALYGGVSDLMYHLITQPLTYSLYDPLPLSRRIIRLFTYTEEYGRLFPLLLPAAITGSVLAWRFDRDDPRRQAGTILASMFAGAGVAVALGPEFWLAYYLIPMPLASLAGGLAVFELGKAWPARLSGRVWTTTAWCVLVICLVGPGAASLKKPVKAYSQASRLKSGRGWGSQWRLANQIRRLTRGGDELYVWGFVPDIYVLSRLPPANKYRNTNTLVSEVWSASGSIGPDLGDALAKPDAWSAFMADLHQDPPRFFVDGARMWSRGRFPVHRYQDLHQWLVRNYEAAEPFGNLALYIRRDQPAGVAANRPVGPQFPKPNAPRPRPPTFRAD